MAIPPKVVIDLLNQSASTGAPGPAPAPAPSPVPSSPVTGAGAAAPGGFRYGPFKVKTMNDAQSGAIGAMFGNDFLSKLQAFIQALQQGQPATFPVQFPAQNSERRAPRPAGGPPAAALQNLLASPQAQEWQAKFPFFGTPPTAA